MLEFYESIAARLQRFEPLLSIAAVALFVAVAVLGLQAGESPRAFQALQLAMLWICGIAVVSRLFNVERRKGAGGAEVVASKVRGFGPFMRSVSPHLMTSWFLVLVIATALALGSG